MNLVHYLVKWKEVPILYPIKPKHYLMVSMLSSTIFANPWICIIQIGLRIKYKVMDKTYLAKNLKRKRRWKVNL